MEIPVHTGSIVYSRAGRDSGRFYLVVEVVSDVFVKIADGHVRRLASPKLKKIKHLKCTGEINTKIADKLVNGAVVYDAEIFSALKSYNG